MLTAVYVLFGLYIILYLLLSLEDILHLVLLLIFLLIFIILMLYISLYLPLCLSFYDIYWLPGARCFTSGQIAESDPAIMGSNLDSAPNTFTFNNAKKIFLICFLRIYSRIDSVNLQIQLWIMYSCNIMIYMFVCLFIPRGACSSVGRAWCSQGFESHLVYIYPTF